LCRPEREVAPLLLPVPFPVPLALVLGATADEGAVELDDPGK
jgi:hypothetical protein